VYKIVFMLTVPGVFFPFLKLTFRFKSIVLSLLATIVTGLRTVEGDSRFLVYAICGVNKCGLLN